MSERDSAVIFEKWRSLFNNLEIIERGNSQTYSDSELLRFERQTGITLPWAFKEFCQVFGAGVFGDFGEILGCPNLDSSKEKIANYRQAIAWELEHKEQFEGASLAAEDVEAIHQLFDSALVFGGTSRSECFLWDLRTFDESDCSYDIYLVRIDRIPAYFLGRDFSNFVCDFCLGMKAFEVLPQELCPYPEELHPTFTRWGVLSRAWELLNSNEIEIWCRNIESGAVLKLVQMYQQQGQLTEALSLCLRALYWSDLERISSHNRYQIFIGLLHFAAGSLLESVGEEQYCQIYRTVRDPVFREKLERELEVARQWQQRSVIEWRHSLGLEQSDSQIIALFESAMQHDLGLLPNEESTVRFNPLQETIVASLPDEDPEFQQLSQSFFASIRHRLASGSVLEPLFSHSDLVYAQVLAHLRLPTYPMQIQLLSQAQAVEQQEEAQALREKINTIKINTKKALEVGQQEEAQSLREQNHYAFLRYIKTLRGHTDKVYTVAFSPDGRTIASGSADTTIKLWDSETKQEPRTLTGHTDSVLCVAISPDGQTLASGSVDRTVKLWDIQTGQERQTLTGHTDSVLCVAISPDGQTLASGGADAAIKLWDLPTQQERLTLTQNCECVYSLCFHPQGQALISTHRERLIKIWELNTCELIRTIPVAAEVVSIAVSSDGQVIAGGGGFSNNQSDVIWIWNFNTGKRISSFGRSSNSFDLHLHRGLVFTVAFTFSPDNSLLASASMDGTIKLWGIPKPFSF